MRGLPLNDMAYTITNKDGQNVKHCNFNYCFNSGYLA